MVRKLAALFSYPPPTFSGARIFARCQATEGTAQVKSFPDMYVGWDMGSADGDFLVIFRLLSDKRIQVLAVKRGRITKRWVARQRRRMARLEGSFRR